ncbi:hypothetical protein ASE63_12400 [Bosea sp. Root381]|uniref:DUF6894 family protein n=1 Tax=Bosea sp. Root381 TaxID=1736524 RepID=UPI0006FE2746|nr:hypothetical protein [Bosea sp. Root381]KRD96200.1 hypothetical protein ASE63_12400 [Bosea sp. Root381]
MPHFKVTSDIDGNIDENIVEFPTVGAAKDDAQIGLADAARDTLPNGSHATFSALVEDASGNEIYRASLDFKAKDAGDIFEEDRQADEAADAVALALRKPTQQD